MSGASRVRAAAIVVREGHVLLMRRRRDGEEFWVVPGGGVEAGETSAQACVRELAEETTLRAGGVELVHRDVDSGTDYFLVVNATGEARIAGPEAVRNSESNHYRLEWLPAAALPRTLRPTVARQVIATAVSGVRSATDPRC